LGREERPAAPELRAARLVAWRRAPHGGNDVAVGELETVVACARRSLAREAVAVERLVQPGAARVAREHAAGAVRAVRRGGEPDDEQTRARVAEPWERLPQYSQSRNARFFSRATRRQYARSRGQRAH